MLKLLYYFLKKTYRDDSNNIRIAPWTSQILYAYQNRETIGNMSSTMWAQAGMLSDNDIEVIQETRFIDCIETLQDLKDYIKKSAYWADMLAVNIIE